LQKFSLKVIRYYSEEIPLFVAEINDNCLLGWFP